jgi:hypothetical protein
MPYATVPSRITQMPAYHHSGRSTRVYRDRFGTRAARQERTDV